MFKDDSGTDCMETALSEIDSKNVFCHIYLDRGTGFDEKKDIRVKASLTANGVCNVIHRLGDTKNLVRIGFDIEDIRFYILKYLNIRQGTEILPVKYEDYVDLGEGILLMGNAPRVCADIVKRGEPLTIEAEFMLHGEEYTSILERAIAKLYKETKYEYKKKKEVLKTSVKKEKKKLQKAADKEILRLKEQLNEKTVLLGAYQILADSKDMHIVNLERIIADKESMIADDQIRIGELDSAVEYYRRYPGVRFVRFIWRILMSVKARIFNKDDYQRVGE